MGQAGDVKSPIFSHQETIYIAHEAKKNCTWKSRPIKSPTPGRKQCINYPTLPHLLPVLGGVGLDIDSRIKAPSCAAIFRLRIVVLQCVHAGKFFCGLHVAHVHIICPVCDVTHVGKCTRPSPAFPYCKRRKAGRGPGNEAIPR